MATRILIIGLNTFDSGKTSVASQLARSLSLTGRRVEFFKPVSGHNYWLRYEHTRYCLENKKLISYDATQVRKLLKSRVSDLLANPVHTLYVPARLERPGRNLTTTLALAGWDSVLAMERMSRPYGGRISSIMLMADTLIREGRLLLTQEEAEKMSDGTAVRPVKNLEESQAIESENLETCVGESFREVERMADTVVIESFNDSVWPWEGLDRVDKVLAVGPGQVFTYDPERLRKAAFLVRAAQSPIRGVTFTRVSDLVRPTGRSALNPGSGLTDQTIRDLGIF